MPREDRRVSNIKQDSINEIDYYPSNQSVAEGEIVISHPKGKSLRLYKKLKGMLWWNNFTKDGNQIIEKNLEIKGNTVSSKVGIGTLSIPDGGIGYAKLAMSGTTTSSAGTHIQYTTSADSYPVFQQLNWGHDNVSLNFDAYYDGLWKSSDDGSSFSIMKYGNILRMRYDVEDAGDELTWLEGISLNASGKVGIGTVTQSANADLTLEGGVLNLKETTEPTADAGYGKIYTKSDDKLYFQDGAGQEYEIDITAVGV